MKSRLHPHQTHALEKLRDFLNAGHRRPMVQAPTGAGKTIIAAAIADGALTKGKRVLFVVPFLSLVDQTVAAFAAQGITSVGVIQAHHPMTDAGQPVQIASLQTLQRRRLPPADIVIIDEAHRWYRFLDKWMGMPEWHRVPFVGLSATPWTKGLGKHYDHLIVAATTGDLIEKCFLSPFRAYAPAHPDLSAVQIVAGDFHEAQLSEAISQPVLIADTVTTWLRLGEDRPTLCFAVDRAHARKLADQFESVGVPTGYVDAHTPADERQWIGRRLREGQIKVVCNVYCLTTGVDWDVRCIVLARPTKSEILYTQIIGRGLRIAEGKTDCLVLDHSDGELIQLNGKPKGRAEITNHSCQEVYSMLLWVQRDRGYKPGYAAAKYRARYGKWPRGLLDFATPPDAVFANWLKSQEIAFYKRRQKEVERAA